MLGIPMPPKKCEFSRSISTTCSFNLETLVGRLNALMLSYLPSLCDSNFAQVKATQG